MPRYHVSRRDVFVEHVEHVFPRRGLILHKSDVTSGRTERFGTELDAGLK